MKHQIIVGAALAAFAVVASAQDLTWRKDIEPIIKQGCAECHDADSREYGEWMLLDDAMRRKEGPRLGTLTKWSDHRGFGQTHSLSVCTWMPPLVRDDQWQLAGHVHIRV